jgi:hypothetical protein
VVAQVDVPETRDEARADAKVLLDRDQCPYPSEQELLMISRTEVADVDFQPR